MLSPLQSPSNHGWLSTVEDTSERTATNTRNREKTQEQSNNIRVKAETSASTNKTAKEKTAIVIYNKKLRFVGMLVLTNLKLGLTTNVF